MTDRSMPMLHRIAGHVAEMRRDRGWAQSELARNAGLNRHVINSLENETTFPSEEDLARIADALGTSVAVLRGLEFRAETHHVVRDRDTRSTTVAYYDGRAWYLPGSSLAFPPDAFGREHSRFDVISQVAKPAEPSGSWKVEYGQYQ